MFASLVEWRTSLRTWLIISRNRPDLGRGIISKGNHDVVDIAPEPSLGWIVAFHDLMPGGVKMLGGMPTL